MWLTGHGGITKKSLIRKCNETTAAVGERKGKREGDGDGILMHPLASIGFGSTRVEHPETGTNTGVLFLQ